ncbi:MAG: Smr/MutS family protein [Chloroflexi bacterium]|nr:Smr/MutS family protein [Chloroflexota bacterium]
MTDAIPQVDLHRLTVEEALAKVDNTLYSSYGAGYVWVRVVHGKGTGTLRLAVRRELARHPLVKRFRSGLPMEGGEGVTVVELINR